MSNLKKSKKNNSKYASKGKSKLRPFGHLTQDLEDLLAEAAEQHELQLGEILSWVHQYLVTHYPDCVETYHNDTNPIFFYGCPEIYAKLYTTKEKK